MPDEREEAWFAIHDALPAGWRIGRAQYDPGRHAWVVAAHAPTNGRGRIPESLEGLGADEIAALWDLHHKLEARG